MSDEVVVIVEPPLPEVVVETSTGGGAVDSVVGQVGVVTAEQILAAIGPGLSASLDGITADLIENDYFTGEVTRFGPLVFARVRATADALSYDSSIIVPDGFAPQDSALLLGNEDGVLLRMRVSDDGSVGGGGLDSPTEGQTFSGVWRTTQAMPTA